MTVKRTHRTQCYLAASIIRLRSNSVTLSFDVDRFRPIREPRYRPCGWNRHGKLDFDLNTAFRPRPRPGARRVDTVDGAQQHARPEEGIEGDGEVG